MMQIARLLLVVAGTYLLLGVFMYVFQRQLQYAPNTDKPGTPKDNGVGEMREIRVKTDDGLELLAWFAPPGKKGGRIVVMFHGNAGNLSHRAVKARYFLDRGYGVYMCEYRGFGGNRGWPSEQGFYTDARAGLKWLVAQGYSPSQFAIYGESIGTGVAVQMAAEMQPEILILEAPFSNTVDVAKGRYFWLPVDLLLKDRFDSIAKIGAIKSSLLIVHGDEDAVIAIALSRRLFEAANHPKEFATINGGGHSDLYDHHAGYVIADWLDKQP